MRVNARGEFIVGQVGPGQFASIRCLDERACRLKIGSNEQALSNLGEVRSSQYLVDGIVKLSAMQIDANVSQHRGESRDGNLSLNRGKHRQGHTQALSVNVPEGQHVFDVVTRFAKWNLFDPDIHW